MDSHWHIDTDSRESMTLTDVQWDCVKWQEVFWLAAKTRPVILIWFLFFFLNGLYRVHNRIGFSRVEESIESTQSRRNDSIRAITALNMLLEGAVVSWLRCNFKHFKDPVIINSITYIHDSIIVRNRDASRLYITFVISSKWIDTRC